MTRGLASKKNVYQTKPRLNAFEQPSFLRTKKQADTFWGDDDVRPFRLSVPQHVNRPLQQKQKKDVKKIKPQANYNDSRPANTQRKQRAPHPHAFTNRQSESYIYDRPYSTLVGYFVQKIYSNWIEKELYFSMSKLSFLVLIVGLFFLSSLLFITGFLVAVNIYDIGAPQNLYNANVNFPSAALPTIQTPNMPSIVLPSLPTPPTITVPSMPTFAPPNMPTLPSITIQNAPPNAAAYPTPQPAPTPNIMKSGTQGNRMGDVNITDTAHMPSAYAQLPTQTLPSAPQPMPQSGGYYNAPQQASTTQHMPSQMNAQTPQQPSTATMQPPQSQAPIQQYTAPQPYTPQMQPPQAYYPPQNYPGYPSSYYQPQAGTH